MNLKTKTPAPGGHRGTGFQKQIYKSNIQPGPVQINGIFPNQPEAESGLLCACLADSEAVLRVSEIIEPRDFYTTRGMLIFRMLQKFSRSGRAYTPQQVICAFEGHPEHDNIENFILEHGPYFTSQTSTHFARIVLEQSLRRRTIKAAHDVCLDSFDQSISIHEILDRLRTRFLEISRRIKKCRQ